MNVTTTERIVLVLMILGIALWPLWAMFIDAYVASLDHRGGFLAWGDLVTLRTPAIAIAVVLAFIIGRRQHQRR